MLSCEQIRFFRNNGYLLLKEFWDPSEVAAARSEVGRLLASPEQARPGVQFSFEPETSAPVPTIDAANPRRVWMIFDTPLAGDWWYYNIRDRTIVEAMGDLLGPNINFHNGKARIKPPGYVSHQGWHQDWPYERHSAPDLAAALFYLDDTEAGASATEVIAGSHLRGEWEHTGENIIPDAAVDEFGTPPTILAAPAGSVAIIHVLTVHRATSNRSNKNRSAIINEYKTMEALDCWGNSCAFAELPLLRSGAPV